MGNVLVVQVRDVNLQPVQAPAQLVRVDMSPSGQSFSFTGRSDLRFAMSLGTPADITVSVTAVPGFMPFQATVRVTPAPGGGAPTLAKTSGGMIGAAPDPADPTRILLTVVLSMMQDITFEPAKIAQPPQSSDWLPNNKDYAGRTVTALDVPQQPLVSSNPHAQGPARLNMLPVQFSDITPKGRVYIAEIASVDPPKLVMLWRPDYLPLSPAPRTPIGFHLYFHPHVNGARSQWGTYPLNLTSAAPGSRALATQPYVALGYQHLLWSNWSVLQHYQARRRVVFVVPVGSLEGQFGWIMSRGGMLRLLREVNLLMQTVEGVSFADWSGQDVGRVALSGFSYGGITLQQALRNSSDGAGNPGGYARTFYDTNLREIYNLDFAGPGFDPAGLVQDLSAWWRGDDDRRIRIYSQNMRYQSLQGPAATTFDKLFPRAGISHPTFDGEPAACAESHIGDARSLILMPGSMFTGAVGPNPLKYPVFPNDVHHWIPRKFINHAISHSGFPT